MCGVTFQKKRLSCFLTSLLFLDTSTKGLFKVISFIFDRFLWLGTIPEGKDDVQTKTFKFLCGF